MHQHARILSRLSEQGPLDSLAACEASCVSTTGCNEINVSPIEPASGTLTNCILRQCIDPLHPQLTPGYVGWSAFGYNLTSVSADITQVCYIVVGRILLLGLPGVPVIRCPGPGVQSV